jgi:hypothetical protein
MPKPASYRQERFIAEYRANGGNATKAAAAAGYQHPETYGARVLKQPAVRAALGLGDGNPLPAGLAGIVNELRALWAAYEAEGQPYGGEAAGFWRWLQELAAARIAGKQ